MRKVLTTCIGLFVGSCSIAPRVDDLGGLDTFDVHDRLRCEVRDAIRDVTIEYVQDYDSALAAALREGRKTFAEAYETKHPKLRKIFDKYDGVTVGYAFTVDIKEDYDTGGGAGLGRSFRGGSDSIGFTVTFNRQRRNIRTSRLQDEFGSLATKLSEATCPFLKKIPNYAYPMFGDLGIRMFVKAFLDANEAQRLIGPPDHPDIPTMSENLQFVTKIGASVNPGVAVAAVGRVFELASGNLKFDESREDSHQVIITLALPPEDKTKGRPFRRARVRDAIVESQERALQIQDSQSFRDLSQRFDLR